MRYLFIIFVSLTLFACSSPKNTFTSLVKNNPETEEGTIFLTVSAIGKTKEKAMENCVLNAFETVLFRGVPESVLSTPMIENENQAKAVNPKLTDCFTDETCYKKFVTFINFQGEGIKVDNGVGMRTSLKINIRALRTYLEQNNIIRKFGL